MVYMKRDRSINVRVDEGEMVKVDDLCRHFGDEQRSTTIRRLIKEKWLSIFGHLKQSTEH